MAGALMDSMGMDTALEVVNRTIAHEPPPMRLPWPLESRSTDAPLEECEEPVADLVMSRSFCHLIDQNGFPPAMVVKEELMRLIRLSRRAVMVMYPADAPHSLSALASNMDTGFSLEGFIPCRWEKAPSGCGVEAQGDLYIFVDAHSSSALPPPFGISGGPSVLSPIRGPEGFLSAPIPNLFLEGGSMGGMRPLPGPAHDLPGMYRLAALRPYDQGVRTSLGAGVALQGDPAEGARILKGVLSENPRNRQARLELCRICLSGNDFAGLRAFLPELFFLKEADPSTAARWPEIAEGLMLHGPEPLEKVS
jgi:hypothetical protein